MYTNPYNQPTYPGPGYPPPAPVPPPLPHQRLWRQFRSAKWRTQWGLGCLTLLLVMSICTCAIAGAAATTTKSSTTSAGSDASTMPSATPTTGATSVALVATATKQVTSTMPTPSPTPEQVPTPAPTATPIPQPTQPPTPRPTQPPAPTQPPVHTGVNGNPWGYDFTPGNYIYAPPANFCTSGYFNCIGNFWNGRGYVDECVDGMYSKSGGIQGACSRHGDELKPLYSH